jgi:hypothetical protein
MPHKARLPTYTKAGERRIIYAAIDDTGTVKTMSPIVWHRLALDDTTPPSIAEEAARMRLKATRWTSFGRQVDDNTMSRQWPEGERCRKLCDMHGIAF